MAENLGSLDVLRKKWGVPLAVAAALLVWILPTPTGLELQGHKALVVFAGVFVLYLTEALSLPVTSILIVPLCALWSLTTPAKALAPFASTSVFLLIGAFILAVAMVKTRLAERITYVIMSAIGSSARNLTIGVTLANVVLAFLVPSSTARTAILLPVCAAIISLYGVEGRTKFSVNLLLTLAFTNATISAGILTATVPNPVTIDFIVKAGGPSINYIEWFKYGFPPAVIMTVLTWAFIQILYRPEQKEIPGGSAHVAENLAKMGPMTGDEKRTLLVFALVVFMWITGSWTRINSTIACLLGTVLLMVPRFGVITWKEAEKGVSWQIAMITGGGMALGGVLTQTGAAKWIANSIFQALGLGGLSMVMVLIVVLVIIQYMHLFFVGTTVMLTALMPIVMGIAESANLPPALLGMPVGMIIGGYPLLMFYNTLPNIMAYDTGKIAVMISPKQQKQYCGIIKFISQCCFSYSNRYSMSRLLAAKHTGQYLVAPRWT